MVTNLVPWRTRVGVPVSRFEQEMENLMDRFFSPWEELVRPLRTEGFAPRTNVAETDAGFEVTVELPGMKAEDFHLELHGNELWISGEVKKESEEKGKTFHRVECYEGEFRRVIALPAEVDADKIDAEYHDGILKVCVPKAEAVKPKQIAVKT